MNVTHVVPFVGEEASGPAYSVPELCFALIQCGYSVRFVTLCGEKKIHMSGIECSSYRRSAIFHRLGISYEMKEYLFRDSDAPDLYHNHSLWMMPNVYACLAAKKLKKPLVVSPRGTLSSWAFGSGSWVKKLFWPFVQRPALDWTVCFHATAVSEYDDIRRHGFRQPVAVIPNGIHIPDNYTKKENSFRTLLFLGRIHPIKGLDILLPAWRVVQKKYSDWQLRIIGTDNQGYLKKIKRLAQDLDLERVEFSGPLYGKNKWQAYRDAEIFILPSYSENFGVSVAEALATGIPAIVTTGAPWGGLPDNNCGWWIEARVDALVAVLEQALSLSGESLAEMGARGRSWMCRDFSWNTIGQKMAATYTWILRGGVRPSWILE